MIEKVKRNKISRHERKDLFTMEKATDDGHSKQNIVLVLKAFLKG